MVHVHVCSSVAWWFGMVYGNDIHTPLSVTIHHIHILLSTVKVKHAHVYMSDVGNQAQA